MICTTLVLLFLVSRIAVQGISDLDVLEARDRQDSIACLVKNNRTLLDAFQLSVRQEHGIDEDTYEGNRYGVVGSNEISLVKCFSQHHVCGGPWPNINPNYTWCIAVYHPTEDIQLCYSTFSNGTNGLVNITDYARFLGMENMFRLPSPATCSYQFGCLSIEAPYFLEHAYLTCTTESNSDSCMGRNYAKEFMEIDVHLTASVRSQPTVDIKTSNELVIGETNIFHCVALFEQIRIEGDPFSTWLADGETTGHIHEHPHCQNYSSGCTFDPTATSAKRKRIRSYQQNEVRVEHCHKYSNVTYHNWLVIDNAVEDDANITFTCVANQVIVNPSRRVLTSTKSFTLVPVPPLQVVIPVSLPDATSEVVLELGANVVWSSSVQAGEGDDLIWMKDGEPVTIAAVDMAYNCFNSNSHSKLPPVFSTPASVVEAGGFKRNFTSQLFICGMAASTAGLYELVVNRSRGEDIVVWSANVSLPTGRVEETVSPPSTVRLTIAVSVTVPLILLLTTVCLVSVIVCVRRRRRERKRSSQMSGFFDNKQHFVLEEKEFGGRETDDKSKLLLCPDPLEFPRNKLIIFDTPLGEGRFGLVLQAKAEGIVEGSPERNVVAIKTFREKAPMEEVCNLWEELKLMKEMKPHENIVNLLGYCSTQSPLYILMEYAVHGSLKDFLHDCDIVVKKLNMTPHVAHFKKHTPSVRTFSNASSTYPLLVDKTPLSAQNSVFSPADTPTTASKGDRFEFPLTASQKMRERFVTQDSGFFSDTNSVDAHHMACVKDGTSLPMAHTVAPLSHDYINSKGLIYMEDVQNFALQIACGLQHLEDIGIVHCDIAARNILISEGFVLKIGDFGMARDVSDTEYYRKYEGRIPVKWTAPEALQDHVFTYKSDIWSYGVVLWEIFSYGQKPYQHMRIYNSWDKFIHHLVNGHRLSQPDGCPDSFYQLMLKCWRLDPDMRPSATELVNILAGECYEVESSSPECVSIASSISSEAMELSIKPSSDNVISLSQQETVV